MKQTHFVRALWYGILGAFFAFTFIFNRNMNLLGGCLFLGDRLPSLLGFLGIAIVTIGIIGNSLLTGSDLA